MIDGINDTQKEIDRIKQEEQDPEVEQGVYANLANAFNIEDREDEQETETTSA